MYNPSDISSIAQLSSYLRTTENQLQVLINGDKVIYNIKQNEITKISSPPNQSSIFEKFYIPKRNKRLGFRIVYKPKDQYTTNILKALKFNLDDLYKPVNCVHGFVRSRNTRTNALVHLSAKFLLKIDIKDFFESIDSIQVKNAFIYLGFKDEIAQALANITTLDGRLIQGFTTSPVIANMVCTKLDLELDKICRKNKCVYSRYADDISISSNLNHPSQEEIRSAIESYGFCLNETKTQRFKRGQNQYITGLSITDIKYPRIPKAIKRRLRQQLYYLKIHGFHSHICYINDWEEETDLSVTSSYAHQLRNKLKGWIDYIHSIEPLLAKSFYSDFNQIEKNETEERRRHMEANRPADGIYILDLEFKEPILKQK